MPKKGLKKLGKAYTEVEDPVIGFFDETSPQTTSNTVRVWGKGKTTTVKNTTLYRANTFGFYPLNGTPVVSFQERSKQENVIDFLEKV
ncbi:MAG: IS630 family transposase, partial [Halobacteria archaeon]